VTSRAFAIVAPSAFASDRAVLLAQVLPLPVVAWGALAFGAVYPWAYWPLAAGACLAGVTATIVARGRADVADRPLRLALAALAVAVLFQLFPLPAGVLAAISPHTVEILRGLNPAFAAGLLPSHPLSVWPRDTLTALALYASFAVLLIGMARLLSVTGSRRLVEALTALGLLLALVGIVQKPLYSGAIYGMWELELGRTPFGPFVNRNHFAGWMIMVLPLTLALLSAGIDRSMRGLKPGWRSKVLWFSSPEASQLMLIAAASVVMALSVMLTMSRSGIIAFTLSLLVMGWFALRALGDRARRATAAVSLAVLLLVVVTWAGPDALVTRFTSGEWGELSNRRGAWADARSVIQHFPLVGTGLNTYWAAALFYQQHELTHFFAQAHNDYLQLAAEGGVLLVVPALVCLGIFIRDVRRAMREQRGSMSWWLRAGAVTSLLAIACQEVVEFSLQMPGNAALFAVVCAIALHRPPHVGDGGGESVVPSRPLRVVPVSPFVRSALGGDAFRRPTESLQSWGPPSGGPIR
jgi:O-antigen ligase